MANLVGVFRGLIKASLNRTFLIETGTPTGLPRLIMVMDAVTSEVPTWSADVTENPVEAGPEVTDHIQLKNPKLSLQGTISATPLDLGDAMNFIRNSGVLSAASNLVRSTPLGSAAATVGGAAESVLGSSALAAAAGIAKDFLGGPFDVIARNAFISAFERKARFDVITLKRRYPGMVIREMKFPRDQATGKQLIFQLELQHVRIVQPLILQLAQIAESAATGGTSASNLGAQAGGSLSDTASDGVDKSVFASIADVLGGG